MSVPMSVSNSTGTFWAAAPDAVDASAAMAIAAARSAIQIERAGIVGVIERHHLRRRAWGLRAMASWRLYVRTHAGLRARRGDGKSAGRQTLRAPGRRMSRI